jgi:hypothetical protein
VDVSLHGTRGSTLRRAGWFLVHVIPAAGAGEARAWAGARGGLVTVVSVARSLSAVAEGRGDACAWFVGRSKVKSAWMLCASRLAARRNCRNLTPRQSVNTLATIFW